MIIVSKRETNSTTEDHKKKTGEPAIKKREGEGRKSHQWFKRGRCQRGKRRSNEQMKEGETFFKNALS